jgi:hypothetical protein
VNFTALARALNASGAGKDLSARNWTGTLFAPTDGAFAAASKQLLSGGAAAQKLRAVVQYHQVGCLAPSPDILCAPQQQVQHLLHFPALLCAPAQ